MELNFDRVFQFSDENQAGHCLQIAANLLKDFIIPGSSLIMGRKGSKWFWRIDIPGQIAMIPSTVQVLTSSVTYTTTIKSNSINGGFALHSRLRNRDYANEPFGRTLSNILDFPIESLLALAQTDFTVKIGLLNKADPIAGLRDAAMKVLFWSDNESVISRIGQWIHAKHTPYNSRNLDAYYCEVGLSELPFIIRVPIYSDTFLPHIESGNFDIVESITSNPGLLTRGLLLAGLPGSGKTTSLKTILNSIANHSKLESIQIADVKGEYKTWSESNNINYLPVGQNPACLCELHVNLFIPPANLRLSTHIDALSILLSIGSFGGGGTLLPGYIKIFLEEYYTARLLHRIAIDDWPMDLISQRLLLLNCTGRQLQERLQGCLDVFAFINRDLSTFWENDADSVIRRIFGRNGGKSNSRYEIEDVIASRIGGFETSILQFFDYSLSATSIDRLLTERWCFSLNGLSKNNIQLLMATFTLLELECILAGPEKSYLSHLIVFEEAHLVASQSSISEEIFTIEALVGQTVERALAEARSKGCGIILTDQQPGTRLLSSVLANTNTKICHNLLGKDAILMATAMGLASDTNFSLLDVGDAYVKIGHLPPLRSRIRGFKQNDSK